MNLKMYYQKIRDWEAKIAEEFAVIVSNETPDGGKPGEKTEVARRIAAKMIVEGLARLATPAEAAAFRALQAAAKEAADQLAAVARVQVAMVTAAELEKLKSAGRE
jgi:hypothetical protein